MNEFREWARRHPIRVALEKKGMTQYDLALHMDVSASAVNYWLAGNLTPNDENMANITKILGVTSKDIAAWRAEKPSL